MSEKKVKHIALESIKLKEKLGEGGFGIVYSAEWNNSRVAVKKSQIDSNQNQHDREVNQLSRVDHPNIIKLIGISSDATFRYIILEYAECGTLNTLLHGDIRPVYRMAHSLSWTQQCAQAVAYLHELTPKPLLHRDLKPENILLADKARKVKLCDFGTVAELKTTMTKTRQGTTSYMAPEVMQGAKYSMKCDVYSLGITLWEILSREKPFDDIDNSQAKMYQIIRGERPTIPNHWPTPLRDLIASCWAMKANERPTMREVIEKLSSLMLSYAGADIPIVYENVGRSKRTLEDTTLVPRRDINCEKKLGKGYYGIVYLASCSGKNVAVKFPLAPFKDSEPSRTQIKDLMLLKHENLIQIYGDSESSLGMIIMEYAEDGPLHTLLHNSRPQTVYTRAHAMSWAFQCAKGLAYLHGLNPIPVILGNLESRNLLLSDKARRLKIGGLDNIADRKRNMLWYRNRADQCLGEFMDPMSAFRAKYDTLCWGILLWEVLERNKLYPSLFNLEWRNAELLQLDVPHALEIKTLLTSCWEMQETKRPDMSNVVETMKELMKSFPGSEEPLIYNWSEHTRKDWMRD